ncbi:tetratricopeptide repeat protein [Thalassotalea fusca]
MNELLLSEINAEQTDLLSTVIMIEEHIFGAKLDKCFLKNIIETCAEAIESYSDVLEQSEVMINALFIEQLFVDTSKASWPVVSHRIKQGTEQRILSPTLKAIVLRHIIEQAGLEADIVYVPEKVMVRIICDDVYTIIFDPISGESLNWQELDERMAELGGDPSQVYLSTMDKRSVILKHLTSLKTALIQEQVFDKALICVDLLIALRPEDPFERRDRGYLLHQLDCFKVAYDDYQYFVQQCPKDPAAQLLKKQLAQVSIIDSKLH